MNAQRTKFSDLTPGRRALVLLLGVLQLGLLISAQLDIQRRRPDEVRGPKVWWRVICLINFFGPVSYFRWGRRTEPS